VPIALLFKKITKDIQAIVYVGGVCNRVPVDLAQAFTKILRRVISIVSAFNILGAYFEAFIFLTHKTRLWSLKLKGTTARLTILPGFFVTIKSMSVALSLVSLLGQSIS